MLQLVAHAQPEGSQALCAMFCYEQPGSPRAVRGRPGHELLCYDVPLVASTQPMGSQALHDMFCYDWTLVAYALSKNPRALHEMFCYIRLLVAYTQFDGS